MSDKTYTAVIYLVSAIWGLNMLLSMIPTLDYRPDPTIHGIFTVIVGGAFAARAKNGDKDKPGHRHGDPNGPVPPPRAGDDR